MFWELPKVESVLNELCQQWFFYDCGALLKGTVNLSKTTTTPVTETLPKSSTVIVGSYKEKEECIELGFVEKLLELWRLKRKSLEAKAEILV